LKILTIDEYYYLRMEKYDVIILGAGVIGLSTAYYLSKEGFKIVVIDSSRIYSSASSNNAGYIVPTMYIPIPFSISFRKIFKMILAKYSPVKISINIENIRWIIKVLRSRSRILNTDNWIKYLKMAWDSLEYIKKIINDLKINCEYDEKIIYEVYGSEKDYEEAIEFYSNIEPFKHTVIPVRKRDLIDETNIFSDYIIGGFKHFNDAILEPSKYLSGLSNYLREDGVEIYEDTIVKAIEPVDGYIRSSRGDYKGDHIILTTGAWINNILSGLGIKLPIIPAGGYRIKASNPGINDVIFIEDTKLALTPYKDFLSIAGILDIVGFKEEIEINRVKKLVTFSSKYLPSLNKIYIKDITFKYRPCTPDEIPVIDRHPKYPNIIISSGHCRYGLTFSGFTGKIISKMVLDKDYKEEIFCLDRF